MTARSTHSAGPYLWPRSQYLLATVWQANTTATTTTTAAGVSGPQGRARSR